MKFFPSLLLLPLLAAPALPVPATAQTSALTATPSKTTQLKDAPKQNRASGIIAVEVTPKISIAVQPLGKISPWLVEKTRKGIERTYNAQVLVLPHISMPAGTFYKPNRRYRAEKILSSLDRTLDRRYTKIIGLTAQEISTTNGRHYDWGISGYGLIGARPAVASTYKLANKRSSQAVFLNRYINIVNHELGHTFGISHCSTRLCLMADMKGTLKTVDQSPGFCVTCRKKLTGVLQARREVIRTKNRRVMAHSRTALKSRR